MTGGYVFLQALIALVLTALPGVAATLFAVRQGVRGEPALLGIGLAAGGVAALATFWVYYVAPSLGEACSYAVFFGSLALAFWAWPEAAARRRLLGRLAVPLALWALASLFVVFFGLLYGGGDNSISTASVRFATWPTPFASDSSIPLFFSDWLYTGAHGPIPVFQPEWLMSDRPPLQIGYVLTERPFGWDPSGLTYELIGVMLQQLWVIGMWALLTAARVTRPTRALALLAAAIGDVAIVNSFYVWPKLLGAAFILAALALLAAPRESSLRRAPALTLLLGALAGLAFLSHGTSAFGLVPLVMVVIWKGLPSWRWLLAGLAVALALVGPWLFFQSHEDPPGNRLTKWSLAGVAEIDDRGLLETLADSYGEAGVGGTLENKAQNFLTMLGGNPVNAEPPPGSFGYGDVVTEAGDAVEALLEGELPLAVSKLREIKHWHLLWTLGLLLLGLPVIAYGRLRGRWRAGEDWEFARLCLVVFAVGAVGWGLLMFGNVAGRAVATSASLALPLIGAAGIAAGLRATYPRWAYWLVGANVASVLLLYLPFIGAPPGAAVSGFAVLAALASLGGFGLLLLRSAGWSR